MAARLLSRGTGNPLWRRELWGDAGTISCRNGESHPAVLAKTPLADCSDSVRWNWLLPLIREDAYLGDMLCLEFRQASFRENQDIRLRSVYPLSLQRAYVEQAVGQI